MNTINKFCSREIRRHFGIIVTNRRPTRIAFPLHDQNGRVIARLAAKLTSNLSLNEVRILNNEMQKGKQRLVYEKGLYHCHYVPVGTEHLAVTLGIPEVWKLWQSGFADVTGLLGNAISDSNMKYIDSVVRVSGMLWVITDGDDSSLQNGALLAGKLASLRFTRHVNSSKRIVTSSTQELRTLFSSL